MPLLPAKPLRILNLEGSCNFRDLGGYRTRDGRELKWGRVFRTGVLSYFTPNDHEQLNQLWCRSEDRNETVLCEAGTHRSDYA